MWNLFAFPWVCILKTKIDWRTCIYSQKENLSIRNWTVYYDDTMLGLPDEYFVLGINNYEQDIVGVR